MITTNFDYQSCVSASEKIAWKLDDVFPEDMKLDYARPFLPDTLTGTGALGFLSDDERLKLNQITGNSYLYLFFFVEEYIIASVIQHANGEMFGDEVALRALLRFADEEVKHQQLFTRFRQVFAKGFGTDCGVIPNPQAVAEIILSKTPMAVALTTLHLELVTQQHYVEGFRGNGTSLDPFFGSLLKNHWLEESQHAKIDALELQKLATDASPEQVDKAVGDYLDILGAFAGLLAAQAALDVRSLELATGRTYTEVQSKAIVDAQTHAYRNAFIVLGLRNPMFTRYLEQFSAEGAKRVAGQAEALS
jgi:hypothetical protein